MKRKYEQEEQEMLRQQQQQQPQQQQQYASYPPQNAAYATPSQASNMQGLQPMRLFDTTPQQVCKCTSKAYKRTKLCGVLV